MLVTRSPEARVSGNSGNTSFLLDSEFIELIKKTIDEVAMENRNNDDVDAVLLWDTMKMQIRSSSLKYAREKKAKKKEENESSPVFRSRGGVSEFLEPFSPK